MDDLPTGKRKFYAAVADKYSAGRSLTLKGRYHVALRSLAVASARDPPMFGGCLGTGARNAVA
jgi:hypothetical protein